MVWRHAHRSAATGRSPARRGREGGAVIVELAIVSVFLMTLFAGTYDYGQAWRTGLGANEAARTGARVGSARGPLRDADFFALSGVKSALESAGKLDDVERIVVYRSTTADGKMPNACKTGSGTNCQVIPGAAFRSSWQTQPYTTATDSQGCLNIATSKSWCPTTRDNVQTSAQYYGVWVKLRHDYEFPILGTGTDVSRSAVMRLEPKVE